MNATNVCAVAGRLMIAALFLISGLGKASAPGPTIAFIQSARLPFPPISYAASMTLEIVGALLLIVGFKTRWVAAALGGFSVVTALVFHTDFADQNQMVHFLKNLAMTGGLLHVIAFGGGLFSLDERARRAKS